MEKSLIPLLFHVLLRWFTQISLRDHPRYLETNALKRHADGMAIKIKDWGMIPTPANQPTLRTDGINAVARAQSDMAEGIHDAIKGLAYFEPEKESIKQTGLLAKLSKSVAAVNREVGEEMSDEDVKDWDHKWQKISSPRLRELVDELPEFSRNVGNKVANALSQRASVETRRNTEISSIQQSQDEWNESLTAAELESDEQTCALWLNTGKGHFFSADEYDQKHEESISRCRLNSLNNRLDTEPLATLAELEENHDSTQLPSNAAQLKLFEQKRDKVKHGTKAQMGNLFIQHIHEGVELDEPQLQLAQRANLITAKQFSDAVKDSPRKSEPYSLCRWIKTIDELDTRDEESFTQMKLQLGTAPLAMSDKQKLLKRLDTQQELSLSDRRNLSRQLWNIYESGFLGARKDPASLKRLQRLQEEGLDHIVHAGAEDTAQWIQSRKEKANSWICFSPKTNTQANDNA